MMDGKSSDSPLPCTNRNVVISREGGEGATPGNGCGTDSMRERRDAVDGQAFGSGCSSGRKVGAPTSVGNARVIIREDVRGLASAPHQTRHVSEELQAFGNDALHGKPQGKPTT